MLTRLAAILSALVVALPILAEESEERQRVSANVQILFDREDFDALTRLAREYRSTESRSPSGLWMLSLFYRGFGEASASRTTEPGYWQALESKAERWATMHPREAGAHIARAEIQLNRAWAHRGSRASRDVPAEAWPPFREHNQAARTILEQHRDVASGDPHWYAAMLRVALGQSWNADEVSALVHEGLSRFPDYHEIYFRATQALLPNWGGSDRSVEAFARAAVAHTGETLGLEMYARIYWSAAGAYYGGDLFEKSRVDWPDMRRGFEELLARHPDAWNLNHFALFACLARDAETTDRVLAQIEGEPLQDIWGGPSGLADCRTLALSARQPTPEEPERPPFECPEGTVEKRDFQPALRGVRFEASPLASKFRYCVSAGEPREVRNGPYHVFDPAGRWIALGQYEPAPAGYSTSSRQVGLWRYRKPGSCGDWIEWTHYRPRDRDDDGWRRYPIVPNHLFNAETTRCPPGSETKGADYAGRRYKTCERDGLREGPAWVWYEDEGLQFEQNYALGSLEGPFRAYHTNGVPRWEGAFRGDREHGLWRQFDCEGELVCEGEAENGAIVGDWKCRDGPVPPRRGWFEYDAR